MSCASYSKNAPDPDGDWYCADVDIQKGSIDSPRIVGKNKLAYRLVDLLVVGDESVIFVWSKNKEDAIIRMKRHLERCCDSEKI